MYELSRTFLCSSTRLPATRNLKSQVWALKSTVSSVLQRHLPAGRKVAAPSLASGRLHVFLLFEPEALAHGFFIYRSFRSLALATGAGATDQRDGARVAVQLGAARNFKVSLGSTCYNSCFLQDRDCKGHFVGYCGSLRADRGL